MCRGHGGAGEGDAQGRAVGSFWWWGLEGGEGTARVGALQPALTCRKRRWSVWEKNSCERQKEEHQECSAGAGTLSSPWFWLGAFLPLLSACSVSSLGASTAPDPAPRLAKLRLHSSPSSARSSAPGSVGRARVLGGLFCCWLPA